MKFEPYRLETASVLTRSVADDVPGRVDVAVCSAAARVPRCRTRSPIGDAARFFVARPDNCFPSSPMSVALLSTCFGKPRFLPVVGAYYRLQDIPD